MRYLVLIVSFLLVTRADAHPGRGIMLTDDGAVWVADAGRGAVRRIDADDRVLAAARDGRLWRLEHALDGAGTLGPRDGVFEWLAEIAE